MTVGYDVGRRGVSKPWARRGGGSGQATMSFLLFPNGRLGYPSSGQRARRQAMASGFAEHFSVRQRRLSRTRPPAVGAHCEGGGGPPAPLPRTVSLRGGRWSATGKSKRRYRLSVRYGGVSIAARPDREMTGAAVIRHVVVHDEKLENGPQLGRPS